MSVEAMSAPPAIGIGTVIGPSVSLGEMSAGIGSQAFGHDLGSSLGGINLPGLNSNIFSMPELDTPTVESFDKLVPGNLAFTHTEIVWQAQPTPNKSVQTDNLKLSDRVIQEINEVSDIVSYPEVELSQIIESSVNNLPVEAVTPFILDSRIENLIQQAFSEPEIKIGLAIPAQTEQQEIIADAKQTLRAEDALIKTDVEPNIAHQTMLRIFKQTQEARIKPQVLPEDKDPNKPPEMAKIYFEHDEKTDEARKKTAMSAVESVSKDIVDEKKEIATGHDIAELMPNPEPKDLKSEIAKDRDGSYEGLIAELDVVGEISSAEEAAGILDGIINDNHAVRVTNVLKAQKATEGEVQKVLKT